MMKLAIVDNHGMFMEGFSSSLEQFSDVGKVFTFYPEEIEELKECIHKRVLDLLIVDINLDGLNGFDFADEIAAFDSNLPIAFVTGHGNQINLRSSAREHGAAGFLLKDPRPQEFLEQIKRIVAGEKVGLEGEIHLPRLTEREKETLQYLCDGYSNQEIANHLEISERQVERHKHNLMIKFSVRNDKTLLRKAIDLGYVMIG